MQEDSFSEMLKLAKCEPSYMEKFIEKYEPLTIKYSIINGKFHDDLHSQLLEVMLRAVKNFNIEE